MDDLWKVTNTYRLMKPGKMDEEPTFYINDEVGTSVTHSDSPNCKLAPIIFSPNCEVDDPHTTTFSVLWITEDVAKENYLYRDYLNGVDEKQWRSSRLRVWFNVFEEYFEQELSKFKQFKPPFEAPEVHQKLQEEYPAPSIIDWDVSEKGPIPVYTDYPKVAENLSDKRFKIVADPKEAKILWLTSDYEQKTFLEWNINEEETYVNFFKKEAALVSKSHLANLINATLVDKTCIMETYDLEIHLPVFVGSFLEKQKKGQENTWIVKPANLARSIDTWVTNNVD
mmetsp:Transcript_5490/g.9309  ORF Transcript_5490/g.9309 Transcript_5490/m.9309 type:complete len:283 (+) Transcript_5490:1147-1995(+)